MCGHADIKRSRKKGDMFIHDLKVGLLFVNLLVKHLSNNCVRSIDVSPTM